MNVTLLDTWMPTYDVAARYVTAIGAPPAQVYATLLTTDFGRPWIVRILMGLRLLPRLLHAPRATWRRLNRSSRAARTSLTDLDGSDFIVLEQQPPREIVLGITGQFWTLSATTVRIPPATFRDALPTGLAQAVWSFEVTPTADGAELATETRVRTADPATRRQFRRYWRIVAPGSGLIRHAILAQIRREATAATG
jgi:hypothetical protein